nr:peptidylprolyl isomerase [Blastococcus sp. Marseille-P5729]
MSTAKQRREAAHRKLERQIAKRQEAERQRKQQMIILSLVASVVVIGLVTWMAVASSNSSDEEANASGANAGTPSEVCGYVADGTGEPTVGMPSDEDLEETGTVDLAVATNRGELTIELDRSKAPCAVNSFVFLTEAHFFDNTICHRLTSGSFGVLQCGDPTGSGMGGPGYRFNEETPTAADPYPEGTVAMANSGQPGTTGSQFFICYTSCSVLPPSYSAVGTVTEGLEVVKTIAAEGTDNGSQDGAPMNEVRIETLSLAA